ncbi:ribitol-5-phosphate transferase FKTN-like [Neocloeon triangulifer]|uniref:ribitol-5-phosphate transferase FKTN-like n=1 Tax=Neocloeon triangulifer TaxID=2078957 RepID=UPI00286F81C7|nr:ribitol-5-phosphate transferase FKTN-like [Neocloeon triangulifer]
MVVKKLAIKLIFTAGALMLLGQLLILHYMKAPTPFRIEPISQFVNVTTSIPLPIILLDRKVLSELSDICPFCNLDHPLAFGSLYKHIQEVQSLQSVLDAAGFKSTVLLNTLPVEPAAPKIVRDMPTGFLISKDGMTMQLVLLHERADSYWWYGAAQSDFGIKQKLADFRIQSDAQALEIMTSEGALERFKGVSVDVQGLTLMVPASIDNYLQQRSTDQFVECSHSRAAAFFDEFGEDDSPDALKFKHKAWKILTTAKQVLDQLNIPFWLSSGTCLGYYRQCDLITYSKDVDLGIMASDYSINLMPEFLKRGFKLKHIFGRANDSFEISFMYDDLKLDLFFFYQEGDTIWNGGTQAKSGLKFKYIFPYFTLCWTEFLQLKVRVPCETLSYILANYGSGWSTPQRAWDWKSSPSNVHPNGKWEKKDWPEVIQVFY